MSWIQSIKDESLVTRHPVVVRVTAWLGALAVIAALGVLRVATDAEFVFMSAVLLPIMAMGWIGGLRDGVAIAAIASIAWAIADWQVVHRYSAGWIPVLNGVTSFAVYALFVGLLVASRNALHREAELARRDPLTGLLNRRAFLEIGRTEMQRAERYPAPMALLYIDLDRFKSLNDARGHDAGDAALRAVAAAMSRTTRASDTLARIGGDEFAVILPAATPAAAREFANRLALNLREALADHVPVTASVGVACVERPTAESLDSLLRTADAQMYETKRRGGEGTRCFVFQC